ncbi:MAG: tRNA(adenine34) deaminase [Hyphomicrobiales bacterium]|jgi:tRNA(adenine34) deaminase|nr:tRNA(adenine34) deaminase [Hyphomicrobiales bacterium]
MMSRCTRRTFVLASLGAAVATRAGAANEFVAAAFRMKEHAIATGDQAYGAVIVRAGAIVGWGPSRVRELGERTGHAERVAIHDAQRRTGRDDLSGCAMYSTSPPCGACERAAAQAKLARMYHGPDATDAGAPR